MAGLACPYLGGDVELSEERERHIAERHPDLLPEHRGKLAQTLADPDQVRRSSRLAQARLFSRWCEDVRQGKFVVVVVIGDPTPVGRHWIVTAYLARKLAGGEVVWKRA
ncbi:MAG: hypothetical protein AB1505_17390 [Candidatus Latescibacterota bacterium]